MSDYFHCFYKKYASPLQDISDKEKNIKFHLYRDQFAFINRIYVKDLKI